jgi:hypothetical protein
MITERNTFLTCDRAISYGVDTREAAVTDGIIRNNFIVCGPFIGIELAKASGIKVYNNTVYNSDPTYYRSVHFWGNDGGNEFKNNIVFGNYRVSSGPMPDTANNIWKTGSQDWATNWFVNISTGDLHLTENATDAIDKGLSFPEVTTDWDKHSRIDSSTDIGADEYATSQKIIKENKPGYDDFKINSIFPNPFHTSVSIQVQLPISDFGLPNVHAGIYDLQGKLVTRLTPIQNRKSKIGNSYVWDGCDDHSARVPSGIYTVYLQAGNISRTGKVISIQ